jgi:EAL domain-containing protein (putative c-di-GMP-specific phosphodiesterase class I)
MDVTAEGIETAEQLACVRDAACDQGQGYLFDRPLTAEGMTRFLLAQSSLQQTG